jgi:hypothetical protein
VICAGLRLDDDYHGDMPWMLLLLRFQPPHLQQPPVKPNDLASCCTVHTYLIQKALIQGVPVRQGDGKFSRVSLPRICCCSCCGLPRQAGYRNQNAQQSWFIAIMYLTLTQGVSLCEWPQNGLSRGLLGSSSPSTTSVP